MGGNDDAAGKLSGDANAPTDEGAHVTIHSRSSSGSTPFDPHRAVTMKDVAAAARVAQSTVSRILNDAPSGISVSEETRQRVQAIASELGYRPHPFARALRGAPSMLLGAVVRDITDPFFAAAVEALSMEAKERGYSVVLGHAAAKADEALALTAVLEARQCDAIVLLGDFRGERRLVADLRNTHVRVVALWHGTERRGRPFPTVGVDNRAGIHAALEHLSSLGHRHIAFVGAETWGDVQRAAGASERLSELLSVKPDVAVPAHPTAIPRPAKGAVAFRDVTFQYPSRPN